MIMSEHGILTDQEEMEDVLSDNENSYDLL